MSMADILAPAIALARDGYGITPRVSADISHQRAMLALDPSTRRIFLDNDEVPAVGSIQRQPELAETLSVIGRHGRDAFYRGDVAEDMTSYLRSLGGLHTIEDFASAAGEYVAPISATYRGWTVHECPPNGQGIIALMILNILNRIHAVGSSSKRRQPAHRSRGDAACLCSTRTLAGRRGNLECPGQIFCLSDELAESLASKIKLNEASDATGFIDGVEHSDTVYISVVDKDRNAVSFINSIFHPYGSGLMAPKSGVLFHNRGQSFVLKEGHPNAIGPRKRPMHTIIPGMVTRNGKAASLVRRHGRSLSGNGTCAFSVEAVRLWHWISNRRSTFLVCFPLPGTKTIEAEETIRTSSAKISTAEALRWCPRNGPLAGHRQSGLTINTEPCSARPITARTDAPSATDFKTSENVMSDYPQTQLYIDGVWRDGSKERLSIVNPASDEIIGTVANAGRDDLDEALAAASAGFNIWREISGFERSKILRNAAQLLRDRVEKIARLS